MSQQSPQQPVKEFRAGGVSAAIWKNETADGDRTLVQHSVRIQKRFREKASGEWKNSDYFFPNDLPKLVLVAQQAWEYISLRASEEGFEPEELEQEAK